MQASKQHTFDGGLAAANDEDMTARLLLLEQEIREQTDIGSLLLHCANSPRTLIQFNQCFVFQYHAEKQQALQLRGISSQPQFDRESPFVRWITRLANTLGAAGTLEKQQHFSLPAYCEADDPELQSYPFKHFLWTPLLNHGQLVGGMLCASAQVFQQGQQHLAQRLGATYGHAWQALLGPAPEEALPGSTRLRRLLPTFALLALAFVPYPITAIAPVEVSASQPHIVAAPFNAVVKSITVAQGEQVEPGTALLQLDDVEQRNKLQIAREQVAVADARYQRATRSAIQSEEGRRELAIAQAELQLAQAEADFAAAQLQQTRISARQKGIAVYTDKRDWEGRPVQAGEAIIQIADPRAIEFTIDLPVADSIVLRDGARVKVYLDSDPLRAIEAELIASSYQPRLDKRQVLSYRLRAQLPIDHPLELPRIGTQGNAQVFAENAPLIYVLLRRPLTSLRQMLGV